MRGDPRSFFDQVYADCCEAESRAGSAIERFLAIGAFTLRLRLAGEAMLEAMLPSLAHLLVDSASEPNLTICICDSASTEVPLRRPPIATEVTRNGVMSAYCDDEVSAFFQMESATLSLLHRGRALGIYWAPSPESVVLGERAHPLLWLLHAAMARSGFRFVHAAGIGDDRGGVLLAGGNGSGKSTMALACMLGGLGFAGDDFVAINDRDVPWAYSLYSSVKICDDVVSWFPAASSLISNPHRRRGEKALLQLSDSPPGTISRRFTLKAIMFPKPDGGADSEIRPISAAQGLARLAPSSVLPLPGAGRQEFLGLVSLARRVEGYEFRIGSDLAVAVDLVRRFIEKGSTK